MPGRLKGVPHRDRDADRLALVDVFAEAYGFTLPLREFQVMAVDQICHEQIDAILAAGWSPDGTKEKLEKAQEDRRALAEEHNRLRTALKGLADEWTDHGFGVQSGSKYAQQLRDAMETQ